MRDIGEWILAAAKGEGLLAYHSTGCANGRDVDLLLFGRVLGQLTQFQDHTCSAVHMLMSSSQFMANGPDINNP